VPITELVVSGLNGSLVSNRDTSLIDDSSSEEPPVLKGYLQKYVNVAKGYGTRWFVLKDGVLSCE
jgi:oxysterol-binding protein 1